MLRKHLQIPGPKVLIAGDSKQGFFGEVPASELFTGSELARIAGINQGVQVNNNEPWLKFMLDGKIIYKAKKVYRHTLSWDDINVLNGARGRPVIKDNKFYSLRLMSTQNAEYKGPAGAWPVDSHGSEWNRLVLPITQMANTGYWYYPDYVGQNDVPKGWNINYTSKDLNLEHNAGNGSLQWTRDSEKVGSIENTITSIVKGWYGPTYTQYIVAADRVFSVGWSPVLEVLPNAKAGWVKAGDEWFHVTSSNSIDTGWIEIGKFWYYSKPNGVMETGWVKIGSLYYYMDSGGRMQTGWVKIGSLYYYMDSGGRMQTGWVKLGSTYYYMDSGGRMQTGWTQVGNIWYYMNSSGAMQTGWLQLGSNWYYLNSSGHMLTGRHTIGGRTYVFNSSGIMQ